MLFRSEMYERITGENPYEVPMRIYPAPHYTMGGLWVDYDLMSNIEGLYVIGEANFSDHGANRLGASALMQGLADGYFVIPYTIGDYLADEAAGTVVLDITFDNTVVFRTPDVFPPAPFSGAGVSELDDWRQVVTWTTGTGASGEMRSTEPQT
mgnify:CR=1 FL=1